MTHIFRPTQHTENKFLLPVSLLHPPPQQQVLQLLRSDPPQIYSSASPLVKLRQDHWHPEMNKLVVLRYNTVNYFLVVHFDYLAVCLIWSYQHFDPDILKVIFYGRVDVVQKVKEILRLLLLVLRSLFGCLLSHGRPVVRMFLGPRPHQVFQLQSVKHHPKIVPRI